jgi:hypothetical protein
MVKGRKKMKIIRATKKDAANMLQLNTFVHNMHVNNHPEIFKPPVNDIDTLKFFEELILDYQVF